MRKYRVIFYPKYDLELAWLVNKSHFDMDRPSVPCALTPSLMGFVRFGTAAYEPSLNLALRRCWDRDQVVRYDAQVTNAAGQCLVSINHLEYNALADEPEGVDEGCQQRP